MPNINNSNEFFFYVVQVRMPTENIRNYINHDDNHCSLYFYHDE